MSCNCNGSTVTPTINTTLPVCPDGEPCDELFPLGCIEYSGDELVELGVTDGERLGDILQLLSIKLTGAACSDGKPILGVKSLSKTYNSIEVGWTKQESIAYIVSYKIATNTVWTDVAVGAVGKYQITGLTAATKYHIQIKKDISGPTCPSVTIAVTTSAA